MRPRKILTPAEALARAAALCDKCEQCSPDIIRKLAAWGIPASDTAKIIERLRQTRYLDDMRFARAYAHDKMAYSGWGRNKILQGLWAKRLGREYIEASCDELDEEEYNDIARRVIRSKVRSLPEGLSTYENRMKVMRFGVQRGFEARLVSQIINRLVREADE
jgi:regulatory protein